MKYFKTKNGVTILILVITIIVLIILVGVSIPFILKENGVVDNSSKSAEKTNIEVAKEKISTEVLGSFDEFGKIDISKLNFNLRNNINEVEIKDNNKYIKLSNTDQIVDLPVMIKYQNHELQIKKSGEVVSLKDGKIESSDYLVDRVEIGQYVDINLSYETFKKFNNENELSGWRVLNKTGSGSTGTIQLISAGCPIAYKYTNLASLAIDNFADLNKTIMISENEKTEGFTYNGFSSDNLNLVFLNDYINLEKGIHAFGCGNCSYPEEEIITDKYDQVNEFELLYSKIVGNNKVQKMTEIETKFFDNENLERESSCWKKYYEDLIDIEEGYYLGGANYWKNALWALEAYGGVNGVTNGEKGIRLVISLNSGIKIDNSKDMSGLNADTSIKILN